jgi:CubicO group peptidase (beta-lactamase class C family)
MIVTSKKKKLSWIIISFVVITTVLSLFLTDTFSGSSFVIPVQSQEELLADMDTIVKAIEFNGSVLIAHNDGIILNKSYGMADNEKKILNTPQTRFYIASLSKQFTAMATLILYAQKKIDLKDRISKFIPDCPIIWKDITIHHLLTHTSGLQDGMNIDQLKKTALIFQPGTEWDYSNIGYNVLGYIIEQVANQSFEAFLQENIFTPLNMDNTGYGNNQINQAVGYTIGFIKADVLDWSQLDYSSAAGGLYSTTEDLYIWNQALLTNKLFSQNLIKKMFTSYTPTIRPVGSTSSYAPTIRSDGMGYGYGWAVGKRFNHRVVEHSGSLPGFSTYNGLYPDDYIHIIALSNQWDSSIYVLSRTIENYILNE